MKRLVLAALIVSLNASAQQYNTAIGAKFGYPGWASINLKHFFGGPSAIDASIGGGRNYFWIQALYERNYGITDGLEWYWGLGGDIGFWSNGYKYYHPKYDKYYGGTWLALDGVIGLEYTFSEIPFNIALDLGPSVRLYPYTGYGWFTSSLALRYAIK